LSPTRRSSDLFETDMVQRAAFRRIALGVTSREGHIEAMKVNAICHARCRHGFALACQAAEIFVVPGLNGGDIGCGNKHMDVIHSDRARQRWIAKHFDAYPIRSLDIPLIGIRCSYRVLDIGSPPPCARPVNILPDESKEIDDRTRRLP